MCIIVLSYLTENKKQLHHCTSALRIKSQYYCIPPANTDTLSKYEKSTTNIQTPPFYKSTLPDCIYSKDGCPTNRSLEISM